MLSCSLVNSILESTSGVIRLRCVENEGLAVQRGIDLFCWKYSSIFKRGS